MLSSANYVKQEGVLNSGEVISPDIDFKDPSIRIYYHQVKGAQTHLPDGAAIQFVGGMFATKNPDLIAYLDKIADKRGTLVYTKKNDLIVAELASAAEDAKAPAGNATTFNSAPTKETVATVTAAQPRPVPLPADTSLIKQ